MYISNLSTFPKPLSLLKIIILVKNIAVMGIFLIEMEGWTKLLKSYLLITAHFYLTVTLLKLVRLLLIARTLLLNNGGCC
jgi:hypothetical protein